MIKVWSGIKSTEILHVFGPKYNMVTISLHWARLSMAISTQSPCDSPHALNTNGWPPNFLPNKLFNNVVPCLIAGRTIDISEYRQTLIHVCNMRELSDAGVFVLCVSHQPAWASVKCPSRHPVRSIVTSSSGHVGHYRSPQTRANWITELKRLYSIVCAAENVETSIVK